MDSEFNPWASPSVAKTESGKIASDALPPLPIQFRTSIITNLIMLPIGVLMAMMTISAFYSTILLLYSPTGEMAIAPLIMVFLTGATAFGCFLPLRCKILLTDSAIQKTEFFLDVISYSQIESWHHHPVTGTVNIVRHGDTNYVAISNWAMSREKSEILGKVLREKVGPPHG